MNLGAQGGYVIGHQRPTPPSTATIISLEFGCSSPPTPLSPQLPVLSLQPSVREAVTDEYVHDNDAQLMASLHEYLSKMTPPKRTPGNDDIEENNLMMLRNSRCSSLLLSLSHPELATQQNNNTQVSQHTLVKKYENHDIMGTTSSLSYDDSRKKSVLIMTRGTCMPRLVSVYQQSDLPFTKVH
ncbi:hypothetical protein FOZ63_010770, partial [Perkinsus olseni]